MIDRRRLSIIRNAEVWIDADGRCWRGDAKKPLPQSSRKEIERWLGETNALRGRHVVEQATGVYRVVHSGAGTTTTTLRDGLWTIIDAQRRLPRSVAQSLSGAARDLCSPYAPWLVHGTTALNALLDIER